MRREDLFRNGNKNSPGFDKVRINRPDGKTDIQTDGNYVLPGMNRLHFVSLRHSFKVRQTRVEYLFSPNHKRGGMIHGSCRSQRQWTQT